MMDRIDRLQVFFACELERQVEELFAHAPLVSPVEAEIPIIGNYFYPSMPHTCLVPLVVGALLARERFRTDWPDWPQLPLHKQDYRQMAGSGDNRYELRGIFGCRVAGIRV